VAEKVTRRIVFFLGAGASFGAGSSTSVQGGGEIPIPTQDTFWETFFRFCRSRYNRFEIEGFLFRYFLNYGKTPSRATAIARRKLLKPINVEEVFTFLSERNTAPGVTPQLRARTKKVWRALIEEVGSVFSRFLPNRATRKTYKDFRKKHVRSHDTIVSFNYDTIFEHSLPTSFRWYYGAIDETHRSHALRVLKPHGSVNWQEIEGGITNKKKNFPRQPTIVAPTHLKFVGLGNQIEESENDDERLVGYLNQSPQISEVWRLMENEMKEAKAWVFVGYSFPPSDLYFSSVLRSTIANRKSEPLIVIVNPDSMAISMRLQSRFMVSADKIKTYSDLQTFNQITRHQLLSGAI